MMLVREKTPRLLSRRGTLNGRNVIGAEPATAPYVLY